jgi:hypothetical protein
MAHLDAELGVKIAQRLIHEKQPRFRYKRASYGDPLLLAPTQ